MATMTDVLYAGGSTSGACPRLAGYVRGLDRASMDLAPSERAVVRSFSAEVLIPAVGHSVPPGASFYSGVRTDWGSPASSLFWYRSLAVSGDYTWLAGDAGAAVLATSAEGDYITEDPKFFRTVCQGGSRSATVTATEYAATRGSASGAPSGVSVLRAGSGTLLAKTVIVQGGLLSPEGAWSLGFAGASEAVAPRFRFNNVQPAASGAYYLFDQGAEIARRGYAWRGAVPPADLVLYYWPATSGFAASPSSSGTIAVTQFYDEVDFGAFEDASGSVYGNGYVLGDLHALPVEKVAVDTGTVHVVGFGTLARAMPDAVGGFVSAPVAGTNAVCLAKGGRLPWDVAPGAPWDLDMTGASKYGAGGYATYRVDSETAAELPSTSTMRGLYAPSVGWTASTMHVFGGATSAGLARPQTLAIMAAPGCGPGSRPGRSRA